MSSKRLPTHLAKSPLIETIFELRFESTVPASNFLPGYLFSNLAAESSGNIPLKLDRLPNADLPSVIRLSDPQLEYAPLVRLGWGNASILVSDKSVVISQGTRDYHGWTAYKAKIEKVVKLIIDSRIVTRIVRHSLKCIDLLPSSDESNVDGLVDMKLELGTRWKTLRNASIQIQIPDAPYVHIVKVVSSAFVRFSDGPEQRGVVVEVDTIAELPEHDATAFANRVPDELDAIHLANKTMFFDCLTDDTIQSMEPTYE